MIAKLKRLFITIDYELDPLNKMKGLKQERKFVQEYIEEFHLFLIKTSYVEAYKEKFSHYINGLRPSIQEELSLVQINSIKEAYQFSLKVEEKLNKKYDNKNNGRGCSGRSGRQFMEAEMMIRRKRKRLVVVVRTRRKII